MTSFKHLKVREETHRFIKAQASRKGLTIVDYMELLAQQAEEEVTR